MLLAFICASSWLESCIFRFKWSSSGSCLLAEGLAKSDVTIVKVMGWLELGFCFVLVLFSGDCFYWAFNGDADDIKNLNNLYSQYVERGLELGFEGNFEIFC